MEKTAAEWLFTQLWETPKDKFNWYSILEKAKQMEKEQIMDGFMAGKWDWSEHIKDGKESKDPSEYYNETYKK